jgi:hypothetical protein
VRIGIRLAKNIARTGLVFFSALGVIPAPASADATPPRAGLDSLGSEAAVRGVQSIAGWALDPESGIKSIRIYVDGANVNYVTYPTARKDGNPGFRVLWNTRFWANGRHTIKVRVVNRENLASEVERAVTVANGLPSPDDPRPPLPLTGTWTSLLAAPRPDEPILGITVDPQNRLTLWTILLGRQVLFASAQGTVKPDGSFDLLSTENPVRVTGRIAEDRQSVQVTVTPPNLAPFSATGRGWPGSDSLSRRWAGTYTGMAAGPAGDRLRVELSIDPSGRATCQAQVGWLRQSSLCSVTPDGRLLVPGLTGDIQIGWLGEVNGAARLQYRFWHPEYPDLFEVPLLPFQPAPTPPVRPVDAPIRLSTKEAE